MRQDTRKDFKNIPIGVGVGVGVGVGLGLGVHIGEWWLNENVI